MAGARRGLEVLILAAGMVAGFAPMLQQRLAGVRPPLQGLLPISIVWSLAAALLVFTALAGLFVNEDAEAAAPPSK